MQTIILVAAITALISGAAAAQWKKCGPSSGTITNVNIDFCEPTNSTRDRCDVEINSLHNVIIDYIQPKPIEKPRLKWGYIHENNDASVIGWLFGIECPGEAGQEQRIELPVRFQMPLDRSRKPTMRIAIRETGASVDDACVDIPVRLIGEEFDELV